MQQAGAGQRLLRRVEASTGARDPRGLRALRRDASIGHGGRAGRARRGRAHPYAEGERICELADLHRLPGDEPQRDTSLEHGELITAVELPPAPARSRYRKVRDRASFSFALVSVAAALELRRGVVRDVRMALGGVAHKPWRAHAAEAELRGAAPAEDAFERAAEAELLAARPLEQYGFKVALARNIMVRTLSELAE